MEEDVECTCGPPPDAVILRRLELIEFVDPRDDEVYRMDLSHDASGCELDLADTIEMLEWARMIATAPMIASMAADMVAGIDEEEE